jgi:type I restriction enzyme R subunit
LLALLAESIQQVRDFLRARGASLDTILQTSGFERNAAILIAKEAANENDETRKRFEIMCRQVFSKFKACLNEPGINDYRHDYDAINIIYRSLEHDREQADISDIIREL